LRPRLDRRRAKAARLAYSSTASSPPVQQAVGNRQGQRGGGQVSRRVVEEAKKQCRLVAKFIEQHGVVGPPVTRQVAPGVER